MAERGGAVGRRLQPSRFFVLAAALAVSGSGVLFQGCGDARTRVVLAATTTTYDTGLLDTLVARFRAARPDLRVSIVVAGSGEALELGRRGDADVLLVHAPEAESRFMEAGHGIERTPVMYNDFLIVGPSDDPARVRGVADPSEALVRIAASGAKFVSRGDQSGTHEREQTLWREGGVTPGGAWYLVAGEGQGATLQLASQQRAYTLTDRATLRVLSRLVRLTPLVSGDGRLLNLYSVILPRASPRPEAGRAFADWLTSDPGRAAIAHFPAGADGVPLFTPLQIGQSLPFPRAEPSPADSDTTVPTR